MVFNEKVIKYDEKCKILIKSRCKVKSPLSEKVTYNLYLFMVLYCLPLSCNILRFNAVGENTVGSLLLSVVLYSLLALLHVML